MARLAATLFLICTLCLPSLAAAEASWADLFPLMGNVILFGLPIEIAQFCYHLWPLMVGFAALSWIIRGVIIKMGWGARHGDGSESRGGLQGYILHPWGITVLAGIMVIVAMVASVTLKPEHLRNKRFSISKVGQAFTPATKPEPPRPLIPFLLDGGRPWPAVATEFPHTVTSSAEYAGKYAVEIENKEGKGGVYAKLCDNDAVGCLAIRTMFIPGGSSITLNALAGRSYRLHYRLVDDQTKAAQSRSFSLPGKTSFYSAPSGAGAVPKKPVVGNGSFEYGNDKVAALIKLPGSTASMEFNPVNAMFRLIRAEDF
jgi:hypothetical protein